MRTARAWLSYWSWQVPGLRHYCHRCDRILWGWQACRHKPRWHVG